MTSKKRITVVMDDDVNKKLRTRQAQLIHDEGKNFSFSKVVVMELRKSIGKSKK